MRPINPNRVGDWCKGFKAALAMRGIPWPNAELFDYGPDYESDRVQAVMFCWHLPLWSVWAGRAADGRLGFAATVAADGAGIEWTRLPYSPETLRALLVEASRATAGDDRLEAMKQILQQRRSL